MNRLLRLARIVRWLVGATCLGWAAFLIGETLGRSPRRFTPLYGRELDTGASTGLRINGLSPAERAAALELEERLRREWLT